MSFDESGASCVNCGRIGIIFADSEDKRRAGDVDAIEFNMHVMDAIVAGHETNRVNVGVDGRDETIVLGTRWRNNLNPNFRF